MINRIVSSFAFLAICVITTVSSAHAEQKVILDPAASTITWVGRKVTGEHNGTVTLKSGEVLIDGSLVKGGKAEVEVGKVVVKDLEDPKYNAKLTNHLKSPDFFSVEQFPLVQFVITRATPLLKVGANGENTQIAGDLTIKGITQAVEFPAKVTITGDTAEATAKVLLDRTRWDIRYGSGKFFQGLGDKLIYDEFEVNLAVKGKVA